MSKSKMTYWERRAAQRELVSQQKASKYLSLMDESLRGAQQDVIRQIEAFYGRHATDNMVSMAEAKKLLTAKEMKDFKNIDLKRFRELSMSGNPQYDKMLNAISARAQISRLEAANAQIEMKMMELYGGSNGLQEYTYTGLAEIYQESYYRSLFDLAKSGAGAKIVGLTDARMEEVLSYNWSGKEFSNRIWDHQSKAIAVIKKELEKSFATGRSLQQTTKAITDATGVMRSRAEALVRTEASFFNNLASSDSYEDAEIEQYEILATLDLRTSNICREQDGKKYNTKDFKPGTTAPPFHVRCRSTTIPWFDESKYTAGEKRQSMDGLADSQTYEEWYGKNVTGNQVNEAKEKMIQNRFSDKKQYEKYKRIYGKDLDTKSFAEFQNLKYNDSEKWDVLKSQKQSVLNSLDYRDSFHGKFGNKEVREWYISHDKNIVNMLDKNKSVKEQAIQAHSLRNKYRTEARLMMSDRLGAENLNKTRPNQTLEELLAHKKNKYGLSETDAYKDVIRSSQTTNKKVNRSLGLEE